MCDRLSGADTAATRRRERSMLTDVRVIDMLVQFIQFGSIDDTNICKVEKKSCEK